MKLDRLLDDFEFILTDTSQFRHLKLAPNCFVKISDLRLNQINYDGFWEAEICDLTVTFPDVSEDNYNLRYHPGIIKGIEHLDKLMKQYNLEGSNQKEIFQKMMVFGAKHNFTVRNRQTPRKIKAEAKDVFERNQKKLETFLKTKKTNKKLSYDLIKDGEAFHYQVNLPNKAKVFIRVASYDTSPKNAFEKVSQYLSKDIENKKNKFGEKKTFFYFFQPIMGDAHPDSSRYYKMMFGSTKSLEEFLKQITEPAK